MAVSPSTKDGTGFVWASLAAISKATTTLALPYNTHKASSCQATASHQQQQQHFSKSTQQLPSGN